MSYNDSKRMDSNAHKPIRQGYENNGNYSPGSNNYGSSGQSSFHAGNQHPRRRNDRFKRESLNNSDRLLKQNDTIIQLLKEIRDRLPPPLPGTLESGRALEPDTDFSHEASEQSDSGQYSRGDSTDTDA
jgi:hypothetical protein